MEPTIKDFESAIAELDTIVKRMEEGDLTLEKSMELYERGLQLYERGLQLSRFCHSTLEAAERRIEILNDRGELKPAPAALGLADDEGDKRR
jgi:exodeoxyribonuclease VII small subunit